MTPARDYADQLRAADLRVTRPRLAVLEAVHSHPHADTETIFGVVRADLPEVSRQAVYDVLAALSTVGLVRRIQPSGSVARYESRVGDNHHHVVCRSCGVIADVDCAVGDAPCRRGRRVGWRRGGAAVCQAGPAGGVWRRWPPPGRQRPRRPAVCVRPCRTVASRLASTRSTPTMAAAPAAGPATGLPCTNQPVVPAPARGRPRRCRGQN